MLKARLHPHLQTFMNFTDVGVPASVAVVPLHSRHRTAVVHHRRHHARHRDAGGVPLAGHLPGRLLHRQHQSQWPTLNQRLVGRAFVSLSIDVAAIAGSGRMHAPDEMSAWPEKTG